MSDEREQPSGGAGAAERDARSLPLDRFNAFSDGVFAIAITLLAIEIAVPPEGVPLQTALREMWPEFVGYYISFAFIGGIWVTHSRTTRLMRLGDGAVYALNLVLLLFVGLMPFTTALMVQRLRGDDAGLATLLYGVDALLASLVMTLLILYLAREPALLAENADEAALRRLARSRWAAIGLSGVAIALALVAPRVAAGLYLVTSTWLLIVPLLGLRRHRRQRHAG